MKKKFYDENVRGEKNSQKCTEVRKRKNAY